MYVTMFIAPNILHSEGHISTHFALKSTPFALKTSLIITAGRWRLKAAFVYRTKILIAKIHILAIDNVIFVFYNHCFYKQKLIFGDQNCIFYTNMYIGDHHLPGVIMSIRDFYI